MKLEGGSEWFMSQHFRLYPVKPNVLEAVHIATLLWKIRGFNATDMGCSSAIIGERLLDLLTNLD